MKFNEKTFREVVESTRGTSKKVRNLAGGEAYTVSPKLELYKRVMTWLVAEPKFYGNIGTETQKIIELINEIGKTDPYFVPKLAVYARNVMYLRSAPVFLLVMSLKTPSRKIIRRYVPVIVRRPDEILEALSLYKMANGRIGSLPNQFRKGLQDTYPSFDEYQFGKYYGRGRKITQKNAIRIIHPTPRTPEQRRLYRKIRHDGLETPRTWETVLSDWRGNFETKADAWRHVIPNMGYFAKVRNLRNLLQERVSLDNVVSHIANPRAIAKSRMFPYRFYIARKFIAPLRDVDEFEKQKAIKALNEALDSSADNMPLMKGKTAIFSDLSGSMNRSVTKMSDMNRDELGALTSATLYKRAENGIVGVFATDYKTLTLNPADSILSLAQEISRALPGGNTNGHLALDYLLQNRIKVDRAIFVTDEMLWTHRYTRESFRRSWTHYRQYSPETILYIIDIAGYGSSLVPEGSPNVVQISGYSDKIFKYIPIYENYGSNPLDTIESIKV
jgi:hypothetical protein